ncbi:MAG: hypothetical protein AAF542_17030 [Pseudomonadota bacterium]
MIRCKCRAAQGRRSNPLVSFPFFVVLLLVFLNACSNSNDTFVEIAPGVQENEPTNSLTAGFTALIGATSSTVNFSGISVNGYEFYRSREEDCDQENYSSCDAGQFDVLDGTALTDTALTLANDAYYSLFNGEARSSDTLITHRHFAGREQHQVVEFNNKLWLIGSGGRRDSRYQSDVWSSNDGVAWRQETADSGIPARANYQAIVFSDRIWLIGGVSNSLTNTGHLSDIWSSEDGINWTQEAANSDFVGRQGHQLLVFNGRLWLIGGLGSEGLLSDVWSTANGIEWSLESNETNFEGRADFQALVFDQRMWVIAGAAGEGNQNDVWSSSDGINWVEETGSASFSSRAGHQAIAYRDRIWIVAGNNEQSDIWSSANGMDWVLEEEQPGFSCREEFQLVVFKNTLWVIGGGQFRSNDIWSSDTGITWRQRTNNLAAPSRALNNTVLFNDRLWAVSDGTTHSVWSSTNGIEWVLVNPSAEITNDEGVFSRHHLVAFQGRLWAIARESVNDEISVWSTTDGNDWRSETNDIPSLAESSSHLLAFQDRLWLIIPGENGVDAFFSSDGNSWLKIPEKWSLPYRLGAGMIVYDDKMWLIAGHELMLVGGTLFPDRKADVWSTTDGVSWTRETENAEFGPRSFHVVMQYDQKIWVSGSMGVMAFEPEADYWSSSDGVNWTFEFSAPYFSRGRPINVVNDNFFTSAARFGEDDTAWFYNKEDGWRKGVAGTISFPES